MHLLLLSTLVPVFMLLAGASALAQPEGYVTGVYRISMSIDGIRYSLPSSGYSISSTVVDGDTVPTLDIQVSTADAQQEGLPPGPMLKGKQAVDIHFLKETEAGTYQKIAWIDFRIAGSAEEHGSTRLQFFAEPEFDLIPLPADSPMPVLTKVLRFTGPSMEMTGDDWETEALLEK